jgi:hypothetical protein
MRMRWRSRWRSTEAFASSASVRGRGQARDLRAAPADLRGAARPSAGERRGVATRVRVACARRDAPKSEKNPREIPRALERDRETRAWEGDKKEPRASSATVAMQAGALIRIVARVFRTFWYCVSQCSSCENAGADRRMLKCSEEAVRSLR